MTKRAPGNKSKIYDLIATEEGYFALEREIEDTGIKKTARNHHISHNTLRRFFGYRLVGFLSMYSDYRGKISQNELFTLSRKYSRTEIDQMINGHLPRSETSNHNR